MISASATAKFWLYVLKNNPAWKIYALAEFAPPVWAELKVAANKTV